MTMRIVKNGDVHVSVPFGMSKKVVQEFIEHNAEWIDNARKQVQEHQDKRRTFYDQLPLHTREQWADALSRMHALIEPLVAKQAAIMDVKPNHLAFKPTVSYWGKCNTRTSDIIFSMYLLLLPEWCVEQVVVHELAHLIVPNHSPRFHAVMDKYYPRWREARAEIRRKVAMTT